MRASSLAGPRWPTGAAPWPGRRSPYRRRWSRRGARAAAASPPPPRAGRRGAGPRGSAPRPPPRATVIPQHPGARSAVGLATAVERADLLTSFHRAVDGLARDAVDAALTPLLREGAAQVPGAVLERHADCRFRGQGYEVTVPIEETDPRQIRAAFPAAPRQRDRHTRRAP